MSEYIVTHGILVATKIKRLHHGDWTEVGPHFIVTINQNPVVMVVCECKCGKHEVFVQKSVAKKARVYCTHTAEKITQVCRYCGEHKLLDDFMLDKRTKTGTIKTCRSCYQKYVRDRRAQGKEKPSEVKKKPKLFIGQRIGKLTVVDIKIEGKMHKTTYVCKCDCGGERVIPSAWYAAHVSSCGCLRRKENNAKWSGFGGISGTLFLRATAGARKRGIPFKVDIEYLDELRVAQKGRCAFTGLELEFGIGLRKREASITASLDRICSKKGYVKGNLQWVHKDINMMKRNFDNEYFIQMCNLIANKQDEMP